MTSYEEFAARLNRRYPGIAIQSEPRIGSTNSARFLVGGLKLGIPNLQSRSRMKAAMESGRHWAYVGKLLLPGRLDSEFFIAAVFDSTSLQAFVDRLDQIDLPFEGTKYPTNNTRLVFHATGFYANILPEKEYVDPSTDPDGYGPPLNVTEVLYADIERSGDLTPAEVDVVARLRKNFNNAGIVVRLENDGSTVVPVNRPDDLTLIELEHRVLELGGFYSAEVLQTLHLNLIHHPTKHFVILRGISGTGKSRLAKSYAFAVLGANSLDSSHERFIVVPVEPQWTDPSYLVGHEDLLADGGYARTPYLDALMLANSDPMQPVFVLLDEMNRAQVEHYFSNFLSAMEMGNDVHFHSGSSNSISEVPASIPWPANLYLIGTINEDESVFPFSSMVLDRANSQDLSHVDVTAYSDWLRIREPALATALTPELVNILEAVSSALRPFQLHFGNRTVREIALFITKAVSVGASINALDHQIDQKILPKLRGGEEANQMLSKLSVLFRDLPISLARVGQMKSDLEAVDFFRYR
jgi:MoxR-like ATPase